MNKKVSLLLILLLWLLAGCDLASNFTQAPPEETTPNPVVNGTAVATGTPAPDTTPDIAIPGTPVTQTRLRCASGCRQKLPWPLKTERPF